MALDMDYIDVAARLVEFRAKHPDGSLQPADLSQPFRVVELGGQQYIVVVAAAYRTPDDPRPGVGMAYESFPGKTNFTRGSELQNAETSAWGRAIVAALAADTKRGIASAEEVRNRSAEQEPAQASEAQEIAASDFADEIQAAALQPTINDIAGRVKRSLEAGRITQPQYERLGRMAVAKVQTIGGTRDGTSNSDGGSAEPGPASSGPGPDGARAAVGGPGGDAEAGAVRPGVQPGVRGRTGVGGSAQTSRGRVDAPAAAGG